MFNDDKTISVTFADGTDASNYVTFKYYIKKIYYFIPYYEEASTKPTSGEYYVTVSATDNVTIKDAADIDLTWLIDGLRINGKINKYN